MHSAAEIIKINKIAVKHPLVSHSSDEISAEVFNRCQAEMNVAVCNRKFFRTLIDVRRKNSDSEP